MIRRYHPAPACLPSPANAGEGCKGRGEGNETRMARQEMRTCPASDPADALRDLSDRDPYPAGAGNAQGWLTSSMNAVTGSSNEGGNPHLQQ